MAWSKLIQSLQPIPSGAMMNSCGNEQTILEQIETTDPSIFWYPGSGHDLTPLLLDVPGNPTGERLFPLKGSEQKKSLILWMNDYLDHTLMFPFYNRETDCVPKTLTHRYRASVAIEKPDLLYGLVSPYGTQQNVTRTSVVPISIFQVRVKNATAGKHKRLENGDVYTVIFSYGESEFLLRNVFAPHRLMIRVVALIKQGGTSGQRSHFGLGHFEQYRDIPRLLRENEKTLGRVDSYIVDNDVAIDGYDTTHMNVRDWGAGDVTMQKREGIK